MFCQDKPYQINMSNDNFILELMFKFYINFKKRHLMLIPTFVNYEACTIVT